jgi:hypothetical protein
MQPGGVLTPRQRRPSQLDRGSNEGVSVMKGMACPENVESIARLPGYAYSIPLGLDSRLRLSVE